jgi:cytochrome c2/mono/diheme cytochrome c family protein
MKLALRRVAQAALWLAIAIPSSASFAMGGDRPLIYQLYCEGCHNADGAGLANFVPSFVNQIASYVAVPEGREFIIQVPGVAQSPLSDAEIADLMNWLLPAYDPGGLPADFHPFTASEVAVLRRSPVSDTVRQRSVIWKLLQQREQGAVPVLVAGAGSASMPAMAAAEVEFTASEPPPSFQLCVACHTTSSDGANGMGPNLRGVLGRQAGTYQGFPFSKSMANSEVIWNEVELNRFLESPRNTVPNTSMMYAGEPSETRRQEIIAYLKSLD